MTPDQKPDSHLKDPHGNGGGAAKTGGFHPVAMILIGMAVALGVFIALYTIHFSLIDLAWCLPALALSAFLVFCGSRKLRRN